MPSNKNIIYLVFSIVFTIIKGQISPIIPVNNPYSYGMYNTYTPYSTGYSSYYPRNYLYYPQIPPSSISNPFLSGYTNYIDGMSSLNYLNPSLSSLMLRNGMSNSYLNSYMLGLPSSYSWNSRSGISGLSGYEGSLSPNTLSNYIQPDISIPPMGIADTTSLSRNILTNQYIPGTGSGTCKDQLPQCAVYASTGQCSSSPLIMARLCPISCGTGCSTSDLVSGGVNSLNTLSTMGSIDSPFTTLSTGLNGGYSNFITPNIFLTSNEINHNIPTVDNIPIIYDSVASYKFDNIMKYLSNMYKNFQNIDRLSQQYNYNNNNNPSIDYNLPLTTFINNNKDSDYLLCKDSHIDGCPSWAAMGFCSKYSTFMNTYCRGSCNLCENKNFLHNNVLINDNDYIASFRGGYGNILPLTNNVRSGIYPLTERKPSSSMINAISSIPELKTNNYDRESIHLSRKERTNKLRELLEMASE
uniref:ShKT domain-containing protein n=1 Tax=Strongyloides stercoralis TaxID=6248 RepID=A0A0K0E4T4_STRER